MESKRIAVIMPVTQTDLAAKVMLDMRSNTVPPDRMIIIDDSDHGFQIPGGIKFDVDYLRTQEWLGVNAYWNWGVSKVNGEDFVMIINDDVTIHDRLIEMTLIAMERYKKLGVVCPLQVENIGEVGSDKDVKCVIMDRREGMAFTFRRYVLDEIPPIPKELVMYCGEDWYWVFTIRQGFLWGKVVTSRVYHHGSLGARQRGLRRYLRPDRQMFEKIMKKMRIR